MTSILDLKLINLVPQYLRNNKDVIAFCEAWDFQKNEIILAADKLQLIKRIMNGDLSNEEVENLLWENHVDYFDDELTHEQKIKLIQIAYNSHLKKGTVFSIEQQLDVILDEFKILEWFDFEGEPNTFYILGRKYQEESVLVKAEKIVKSYKRASSHMQTVFGLYVTPTLLFKAVEKHYFSNKYNPCGTVETLFKSHISTDGYRAKDILEHQVFSYLGEVQNKTNQCITKQDKGFLGKVYFVSTEKGRLSEILRVAKTTEEVVKNDLGRTNTNILESRTSNYNSKIIEITKNSFGISEKEYLVHSTNNYLGSEIKLAKNSNGKSLKHYLEQNCTSYLYDYKVCSQKTVVKEA